MTPIAQLGAGVAVSLAVLAAPAEGQVRHGHNEVEVIDVPGAPPFAVYVSPQRTTHPNPRLRIRAACRTVFDIRLDGWTENVVTCCNTRDAGRAMLEHGLYSAVYNWRFAAPEAGDDVRFTERTGLIWYDGDRFDAHPSARVQGFLPEPPTVEACLQSEDQAA